MPLSIIVSEIQPHIGRKLLPPFYLAPLLGVKPSDLCNDRWCRKTRMMGLSDGERILMIRSAVLIQCMRVTDGRTDRQTADGIGMAYMRYSIYAIVHKNNDDDDDDDEYDINQHQRNPARERKTFPGSRTTSYHRCGGHDEPTLNQRSENAFVGVLVTSHRHAARSLCGRSASDAESWSESPCCAQTAPRHSSSPTDADFTQQHQNPDITADSLKKPNLHFQL